MAGVDQLGGGERGENLRQEWWEMRGGRKGVGDERREERGGRGEEMGWEM